jgi:hypothetical protein
MCLLAGNPEVIQKWYERVFNIGETVSHEKDSAAPHRRSSDQTFPNRIGHRRDVWSHYCTINQNGMVARAL